MSAGSKTRYEGDEQLKANFKKSSKAGYEANQPRTHAPLQLCMNKSIVSGKLL